MVNSRQLPGILLLSALTLFALLTVPSSFAQPGGQEVGWPVFHLEDGETHSAGKAFAILWYGGKNLLVMPLHILSPEAGFSHYVQPSQVDGAFKRLEIVDLMHGATLAQAGPSLLRTGSTVGSGSGDLSQDLMVFELSGRHSLKALSMVREGPRVGDRVWVLSKDESSRSNLPDRFPGKVVQVGSTAMVVDLDRPLTAMSSSGAPVVNGKGELMGMMVGKRDEERMTIMAIPSTAILARIYKETGKEGSRARK